VAAVADVASHPGLPDGIFAYQNIPKIPNWKCFGGPRNGKMLVYFMAIPNILPTAVWCILLQFRIFLGTWYILWAFGIFSGHLVYFVSTWYICGHWGIFCGHLVYFFVGIWYILWAFGLLSCGHLVYFFVGIWYKLYQNISGNPAPTYDDAAVASFSSICRFAAKCVPKSCSVHTVPVDRLPIRLKFDKIRGILAFLSDSYVIA
jgi:hypothetical protein